MSLELYNSIRPVINSGDLIEWRSNTVVGWMIRRFTGRDVNHTSLALKFEHFHQLTNRRFVLEALERGIEVNLLSRRLEKFSGEAYLLRLKPEYDPYRRDIAGWALDQLGIAYDYSSLFKQILGRVSLDAKKYFCSEYAFAAYCAVGILSGCIAPRPGEFKSYGIHEPRVRVL